MKYGQSNHDEGALAAWPLSKLALLGGAALLCTLSGKAFAGFIPGDLVVSSSTYEGTASTVTVGQTLPGGGTAIANGSYPNVFQNNTIDGSFGVTSPIILQQVNATSGNVDSSINVTNLLGGNVTTSFSSKSELALNLSTNGNSLTFMGYSSPINALDVSNSNTPGIIEPGNPVTTTPTFRDVIQLNADGSVTATTTNAYAGNNGRAAILDNKNNQYLTVGNAGNGNGSPQVTAANGVQIVTPGQNATSATPGTTKVGSFNVNQINPATGLPYSTTTKDKASKDDNYRGETIFNNTLYVTKGSGGNGINSVYQVGPAGALPTAANASGAAINVLPGFPTNLAKNPNADPRFAQGFTPFGIWFANATTLYVADEGDGVAADASIDKAAGLEKWTLTNGTWGLDYTLQNGLNLGTQYSIAGLPTSLNPATDGLRNITGKVNSDGTVTIVGVTSTVSGSGDQGADPNKLVSITDLLNDTGNTAPGNEQFTTLETAISGQVLRGVAFAPVPEPGSLALFGAGLAGLGILRRRRQRA